MGFRKQNIGLVVLLLLLVCSTTLLGWALSASRIHLAILLGLAAALETALLFVRMNRLNREILFFFRALENDDTSFRYTSGQRSMLIDELHQHLNRVNENYRRMRLENEIREQYFSGILEHLSSGLMIISPTGHVNQINQEALRLLNLANLTHIRALSGIYPGLYGVVKDMMSMDRCEVDLQDGDTGLKKMLGLQLVVIPLGGEDVRVLTIHDLSAGMERKEIDDWIRLIRVMSHEIMNSLAPITSISGTLRELWMENRAANPGEPVPETLTQKTLKGLDAIAEQSEGLTTFFESYRVLSRIPDPVKKEFFVCGMYERLDTLVGHYRANTGPVLEVTCKDPGLKILADEQMIIQVMLNLVKNAVQALKAPETGEIQVSAYTNENRIILQVADNGEGIPPELSGEIFMPFYTTRKKGTGVGLSYSRQVMAMNGGRIEFDSRPGNTRFRLIF